MKFERGDITATPVNSIEKLKLRYNLDKQGEGGGGVSDYDDLSNLPSIDGNSLTGDITSVLVDLIYPVGSIYMSVNSTSPQVLFGGTWEQIEDTFLLSAGSNYTAGDTGGEATHTLITDEIPSHGHSLTRNIPYGFAVMTTSGVRVGGGPNYYITENYNPYSVANTGGGKSHNNMPPYLVVYVWKRIS